MGLMLSVLVFCVGVVEALDCWHHFMFHLVTPPHNILPYRVDSKSDILCEKEELCTTPEPRRTSHIDISWPKDLSPTDDLHVIKKRSHSESERKHDHERERHFSESHHDKDADHHRHTAKFEVHTPDPADMVDSPLPSRESSPSHLELGVIVESESSSELDEPSEIENLSYKEKSTSLSTANQDSVEKPTKPSSTNCAVESLQKDSNYLIVERPKSPFIDVSETLTPDQYSKRNSLEYEAQLPQFTDTLLSENVQKVPHRYPIEENSQDISKAPSIVCDKEGKLPKSMLSMSSIDSDMFEDAVGPTVVEVMQIEKHSNKGNTSCAMETGSFPEIKLHESSPVSMEESSDSSMNTSDASMMARSRTSDRPLVVRFAPSQENVARDFMSVTQTDLQAFGSKESSLESEKSDKILSSINSTSRITLDSAYPLDESSEVKSLSIECLNSKPAPSEYVEGLINEEQKVTGQPDTNSSSSSLSGIPQLPEDVRENTPNYALPTDNGFEKTKLSQDSIEDEYLTKASENISSEEGNNTTGLLDISSTGISTNEYDMGRPPVEENGSSIAFEVDTKEHEPCNITQPKESVFGKTAEGQNLQDIAALEQTNQTGMVISNINVEGKTEEPVSFGNIQGKETIIGGQVEGFCVKDTPISELKHEKENLTSADDVEDNKEKLTSVTRIQETHSVETTVEDLSLNNTSPIERTNETANNVLLEVENDEKGLRKETFKGKVEHVESVENSNSPENTKDSNEDKISVVPPTESITNVPTQESTPLINVYLEKQIQDLQDEKDIREDIDLDKECRPQPIQRRLTKRKSSLNSSRQSSIETKGNDAEINKEEPLPNREEVSEKLDDSNKASQRLDVKRKTSTNISRQSSTDSTILEHGPYECVGLESERKEDTPIDGDIEPKQIQRRDTKRKSSLKNSRQSSSEVIQETTDQPTDQPSDQLSSTVLEDKLQSILQQPSSGSENAETVRTQPNSGSISENRSKVESQSRPLNKGDTNRKSSLKISHQSSQEEQPPTKTPAIPDKAIPDSTINNLAVENELSELSELEKPKPKTKTKQSSKLYSKSDVPVICKAKESEEVKSDIRVESKGVRTDIGEAQNVGSVPEEKQTSSSSTSEVQGEANAPSTPKEKNDESSKLIFSGEYTKAMNKDWHSGHFCCWQCDESLTGQRYVLRDEHPYCIKCYESVFANGCEECNKTIGIDSKDLSYKDKHWHEACFLCNKCRVSLVDKQFGSKLDKIFCGNCYDAQFASRCDGCGQIFKAGTKKMEYKTRQWHEPCFACCVCKTPIGTKSFIPREQEIYCATCYEEKFATRCVKCNKIITSGGVTYKNEPWHRECFTCTNCNTSLAGQRFTSRDEKPYCADCFGELFAKRCTACCKPITGIGGTRFISFEDRHWHNDCFICASCKTSLVGRGFITDAEDIICPECAKQKLM